MASGLLFSVFAGSVGQGVIPGAIAAGALAVVWVAVISTVETVEDLSSVIVGRLLERRDPGRVLVSAEAFSLVCALIALVVVLVGGPAFEVFLGFVLVTSVVPLVLDVADELYVGRIVRYDPGAALRFNIALYSVLGLTGSLLARPLGSALATAGVVIVLSISAVASALAVGLRLAAVRRLRAAEQTLGLDARIGPASGPTTTATTPTAPIKSADPMLGPTGDQLDSPRSEPVAAAVSAAGSKGASEADANGVPTPDGDRRIWWRRVIRLRSPGSPLISTLGNLSAAILSTYVSLWAVTGLNEPNRWLAVLFFAVGLGATLGPYVVRGMQQQSAVSYLRLLLGARIGILVGIMATAVAGPPGISRVLIIAVAMFLLSGATVATAVVQATSRQIEYHGPALAQVVGWSHTGAAAGSLVGTWLGILTGVAASPILGTAIAAMVAAAALAGAQPAKPTEPVTTG
jgi:hypothetical protein